MTIATKTLRAPFTPDALRSLAQQYGTPLWLYDSEVIVSRIARLNRFDVIRFAQKANSNIHILHLMHEHGVKVDSVSAGEIERALKAGYRPDEIVFTADMITEETLGRVLELGIAVNTGSVDMLRQIGARRPGHPVWLRINPGFGHGHSQKTNTGGENSKHGIWFADLREALAEISHYQLTLTGIHMHIGSGVDYEHLATVCDAMAELVITNNLDIRAISAGGGLSTPYREGDEVIDIDNYFSLWDAARARIARHLGREITLEIEPGRYLVAESGILLAQVRAVKGMGSRHYVLVDSGFNDLMRPAMYGSYHHISVLPAAGEAQNSTVRETIVAGPLCESGDVFTQLEGGMVVPRALPEAAVNDFLVFHDTGAYGASMSSNYNSRPLLPEILFTDGKAKLIRRRQTIDELMALEITE
ncbi:diaminopimelate decarboxylase [Morganella morganii]|uniref:diaminopimelate decarboxylase n=1 Tax=Morganella morganii TaxID=582 RepID=UPI0023687F61|nr:diaminopimelate decarboxylase [Morganella morganii]